MRDKRIIAFGKTLRTLRKTKGLSQEAFADLVGIDRSYMGSIERGEKSIGLIKVFELTDALLVTPSEFFAMLEKDMTEQM